MLPPFQCYYNNMNDGLEETMIRSSYIGNAADQDGDCRKPTESSHSHKEAERRRRQRINSHFSTLRSLLPNPTEKTDKASLLAGVVHYVRQLTQQLADVSREHADPSRLSSPETEPWPIPSDSDGATLSRGSNGLVKVALCCDDRPSLNGDLARTFRYFNAREVRAEMASSGGRAKLVVLVEGVDRGDGDRIGSLKRALDDIVDNRASSYSSRSRRGRF